MAPEPACPTSSPTSLPPDATVTDVETLEQVHAALDRRNLLPDEHLVDAGYTSAELMVSAQRDCGLTLLGPLRIDHSAQARAGGGFDRAAFTIDDRA